MKISQAAASAARRFHAGSGRRRTPNRASPLSPFWNQQLRRRQVLGVAKPEIRAKFVGAPIRNIDSSQNDRKFRPALLLQCFHASSKPSK